MSGTAIVQASDKVIENGKKLAAHVLEASASDIEFKNGTFTIAGTDRAINIMALAETLRTITLPDDMPKTLDITHVTEAVPGTYPNGVHVVEVEIEPDTGLTRVVKYNVVNDFGTVINPLMVEGQVQGGAVQGLGQVLLEGAVYDTEGQLVTGSFMDYAMPRAHDVPMITVANRPVPTRTNPIGAKGCGEAGTSGGLPAVANAVIDALSDYGIRHLEMPMTSSRIWEAIEAAKAKKISA
jgi:carbon-monoxide dehydrogenase large subunit